MRKPKERTEKPKSKKPKSDLDLTWSVYQEEYDTYEKRGWVPVRRLSGRDSEKKGRLTEAELIKPDGRSRYVTLRSSTVSYHSERILFNTKKAFYSLNEWVRVHRRLEARREELSGRWSELEAWAAENRPPDWSYYSHHTRIGVSLRGDGLKRGLTLTWGLEPKPPLSPIELLARLGEEDERLIHRLELISRRIRRIARLQGYVLEAISMRLAFMKPELPGDRVVVNYLIEGEVDGQPYSLSVTQTGDSNYSRYEVTSMHGPVRIEGSNL